MSSDLPGRTPMVSVPHEVQPLVDTLAPMKEGGELSLALLFGSFAAGAQHCRSDIDLAIALNVETREREMELIDMILMATERQVSILRLDDSDESPMVIQEALKGIHLVEPDLEVFYRVADRVLHESESIRYRRTIVAERSTSSFLS
jgi:predicted nucleotidyltransferase